MRVEEQVAIGLQHRTDRAGFRGTGFFTFPSTGGSAELRRINGGDGGAKTISIRYANGGPTPRTGVLMVNGEGQRLTFKPTGGWTNWGVATAVVNLKPGQDNTLRLESSGQSLANIDEVIVP